MSKRYVALLRAVNVGGRVVKMDRLRGIFDALALDDVSTFITSGNVLFASGDQPPELEVLIEKRLLKELGYPVATFVRSVDDLKAIAARAPFMELPAGNLYVGFLKSRPARVSVRTVLACANDVDRFLVSGREAYWHSTGGMSGSTFSPGKLEKLLGPATLRNITTVRRLAQQ